MYNPSDIVSDIGSALLMILVGIVFIAFGVALTLKLGKVFGMILILISAMFIMCSLL